MRDLQYASMQVSGQGLRMDGDGSRDEGRVTVGMVDSRVHVIYDMIN